MLVTAEPGTGQPSYPVLPHWADSKPGLEFYQGVVREDTPLTKGRLIEEYPPNKLNENRQGMLMSSVFVHENGGSLVPLTSSTAASVPPHPLDFQKTSEWCTSYAALVQHEQSARQATTSFKNSSQKAQMVRTMAILTEELQLLINGASPST